MIIETSSQYQMFVLVGAGPFEDLLWVIRENSTLKEMHKGNEVFIRHKWNKLHETA